MKDSLYLSRSFVEFGPFAETEMLSFYTRGILQDSDYVRDGAKGEWVHVNDWASTQKTAEPPAPKDEKAVSPTPKSAAPAKKAAAKKAAPAKKAATKKAK
ncbi:hypothetical protein EI77_04626 [Prosthecobacter fusiformis]|uniref:GYF domain-containing protein n=1 Tax=Prosthecobacter fusiformis TaxID=48464 RepID=A0A4R7RIA4_9BACT|nr:hypothetical protein [Prosthecobacter fusiformis]TDU62525.1 hypothetical protein EI77_04626 [Prosthecobacter fusiformis]